MDKCYILYAYYYDLTFPLFDGVLFFVGVVVSMLFWFACVGRLEVGWVQYVAW